MGKTSSVLRRSASALAVAIAMMAITGPATAAEGDLPKILNGKAEAQALNIKLTLPSAVAEALANLRETLEGADTDLDFSAIPKDGIIEQTVGLTQGNVLRAVDETTEDKASGFALPLQGLLNVPAAETQCEDADGCDASEKTGAVNQDLAIEGVGSLGSVEVAGGKSTSASPVDTRNTTALAKVRLALGSLIAEGEDLEAVGDALDDLRKTVNEVLPDVNKAIADAYGTLQTTLGEAGAPVLDLIEQFITIGELQEIPDLREEDLLNLTVLGSNADVFPKNNGGTTGLLARSSSKVADVDILGGWATIDAVGLETESFANGVAGEAKAKSDVQVAGVNLGGLLNVDIPEQGLADLANPETIKAKIMEAVADQEQEVQDAAAQVVTAFDVLYNIAGVSVELFKEETDVDPDGWGASANAGTLKITVAPQTPVLSDDPAALAAALMTGDIEYTPTGLKLEISLPNAESAVGLGNVFSSGCIGECNPKSFVLPGRTGVATPLLAGMFLLGMAVFVRRFAMTK